MKASSFFLMLGIFMLSPALVEATSNHEYGGDEYDTVIKGISPDRKYAITTHGGGEYGYDNFQVCLTNNLTGKRIGPLQEVTENLDTGADALAAKWSPDSNAVYIVYRISRHEPLQAVSYRIAHGRAFPLTETRVNATDEQIAYWQENCSTQHSIPKIFGTPKPTSANP